MIHALLITAVLASQRPTVVMIHGAGGGGWEYKFWQAELKSQGWKTIAPDMMPAKGGLAKTTLDDYVAQVVVACRKEKRVILVGASMGGALVLKAAEHVKPEAIVLVDAVPPKGTPGWPKSSEPVPDVIRWANGPIKDTRDSMPDSDEATIQWAWKLWRDESGAVVRALHDGVECRKPTCPVLAIIGREDTDIPPAVSRSVAQAYGADVQEYAGMSHVGPLLSRRAREVAAAVAHWLDARRKR
jgi:pimeloyl-ACP methyl ester carboxylesterase